MIKKYRKKFILIAMCSVAAVLVLILGAINLFNYVETTKRSNRILDLLCENGGEFPSIFIPENTISGNGITNETPFEARYFTAVIDEKDKLYALNMQKVAAITPFEARQYIAKAKNSNKTSGRINDYKYRIIKNDNRYLYVFLDCSKDFYVVGRFLVLSALMSIIGLIGVFLLLLFLSSVALKPIEKNYEKQKAFITNASHDIKTPLTIINAETDLLNLDYGENEYTDEIKKQIKKLSSLTDKLVFLSKAEEIGNYQLTPLDVSSLIKNVAEDYKNSAKAKNVNFFVNLSDNIYIYGNKELLTQAFSLLFDNVLKYTPENGKTTVALTKNGKQCRILFTNDAENITIGNHDEFFERFYRGDKSRNSEKGGNGIGLSVVKAITDIHKGKISAFSTQENLICFSMCLPLVS